MKTRLKKRRNIIALFFAAIAALSILCSSLFYLSTHHPKPIQDQPVACPDDAPILKPGQKIKILSWNVQFMAGNKNNHFFFDGGNDGWPSKETIHQTTSDVVRILRDENPDIIILQEVDDGAKRTHYQDQLETLLKALPETPCHAQAFYWRAWFVPHPAIMGSVGMKLTIMSKYKISGARRHSLSPITTDNVVMRQFKPKRAVLEAMMPVEGGNKTLHVMNGHFSAFAQGSDTMERQTRQVWEILRDLEEKGEFGFVAGDFNLIPPGTHARLPETAKQKFDPTVYEIAPMFDSYRAIPSYEEIHSTEYEKWLTHIETDKKTKLPDKTIDYIFFTKKIGIGSHYVRQKGTSPISDHLPVAAIIAIPE